MKHEAEIAAAPLKAYPEATVNWLTTVAGGLPIAVASIDPETGKTIGKTFTLPGERTAAAAWIAEHDGKENMHYRINAPAPGVPLSGAAGTMKKEDVAYIRGVALDLDPVEGFDLAEARAAIWAAAEEFHRDVVRPTFAIDSGGGLQLLFLFPEPLPATPENKATVEAQARALGAEIEKRHRGNPALRSWKADSTQSVANLFRVPFTVNLPNEGKRKRGRVPRLASVVPKLSDPTRRTDLAELQRVVPPGSFTPAEKSGGAELPGYDHRDVQNAAGDLDALPPELRKLADTCCENLREIVGDVFGKDKVRSECDYRVGAYLVQKHALTDPTALGQVTFAVSPNKFQEKKENGHDENYARNTIKNILARNWPDRRVEDYFTPIDPGENASAGPASTGVDGNETLDRRRPSFSLHRIGKLEPREPDFLVDGLIETDALTVVFGDPGSGKSFLALDMALSVATGRDFHSRPVKAGPVIYIAGEGNAGLVRRRAAWEAHNGVLVEDAPCFLSGGAAQFLAQESVKAVVEAIDAAARVDGPPALIVIDTLARNFGPGDENGTHEMSRFVAEVDKLRLRYPGCSVLIVHHTGVTNKQRARGSGALLGATDAEYRVEKKDAEISIVNTKMKDCPPPDAIHFRLDPIEASAALTEIAGRVQTVNLTPTETLGVETLRQAAETAGAAAGAVSKEAWRAAFYAERKCKSGKPDTDAARRAFNRAREGLEKKGLIISLSPDGDSDEHYVFTGVGEWFCRSESGQDVPRSSGTSGTIAGHVPSDPLPALRPERDRRDIGLRPCPPVPPEAGSEVFG